MPNHQFPHLAVLIGAPHLDQTSMHYDMAAMYTALQRRGVTAEEILCLEGRLDRRRFLDFLSAVHQRIATWPSGALFFYISGHGFFTGEQVEEARVGVELQPTTLPASEARVYWDEILQILAPPAGVMLTLLPDH